MSKKDEIDRGRLPQHVAVIMDGNGRWAKQRGEDRLYGHKEGVHSVDAVVEAAGELGLKYISLYAFSTENWNRPKEEVMGLMDLFVDAIATYTGKLMQNNVRLIVLGDLDKLSEKTKSKMDECIARTSGNTGLNLVLFISYSSRWEIIEAVKKIATDVKNGEMSVDEINEDVFSNSLATKGIPDPDLMIRTSGELRISNFLMWQLSYSELYFTDTSWPDFRKEQFYEAIVDYQKRQRRFGKTGEQIENKL